MKTFLAHPVRAQAGHAFPLQLAGHLHVSAIVQKVTGQTVLDYLSRGCSSRSASRIRNGRRARKAIPSAAGD